MPFLFNRRPKTQKPTDSAAHLKTGQYGEALAEKYLLEQGLRIIARNQKNRYGEIDLIAESDNLLIFVEVRTRKHRSLVSALESITPSKLQKWQRASLAYLQEHHLHHRDCRFDVIAITYQQQHYDIEWLKDVMQA